jgi:predicted CopG family antitoxin
MSQKIIGLKEEVYEQLKVLKFKRSAQENREVTFGEVISELLQKETEASA